MSRLARALVAAVALAAAPTPASAYGYNTVPCWSWDGSAYHAGLKQKPRKCTLGGRYGYQQVDVVKMRWRSWRGGSAYGRGISLANMGYRARVRVKLFQRRRWEEATYRFTRARFNFNGQGWGPLLVLRLN
jgi:glutamine cyclotransferase